MGPDLQNDNNCHFGSWPGQRRGPVWPLWPFWPLLGHFWSVWGHFGKVKKEYLLIFWKEFSKERESAPSACLLKGPKLQQKR